MSGLRSFRMIWVSTDASSGETWRKRVRRMVERGRLWCFGYLERTDLSEYPDFAANSSKSSSIAAIEIVLSKPSSCWIGSRPFNDVSYAIGITDLLDMFAPRQSSTLAQGSLMLLLDSISQRLWRLPQSNPRAFVPFSSLGCHICAGCLPPERAAESILRWC